MVIIPPQGFTCMYVRKADPTEHAQIAFLGLNSGSTKGQTVLSICDTVVTQRY